MATRIAETGDRAGDETVLVLAPTGRDAEAASTLLSRAGIDVRVCSSAEQLCDELGDGAVGAIVIAEEGLARAADLRRLTDLLDHQPPWSDLPFVVLTRASLDTRTQGHEAGVADSLGNVIFLERPLNARTLISAVRAALRARRRQYQVRKLLLELLEDDRRKDEFLATLAHELRNPLAPIRNSLQVMRLAEGKPEVADQARQTIERQLSQLVRLVDDLLDVSLITRNRIELRRERITLSTVVRNAVEIGRPRIEARDQELIVEVTPVRSGSTPI